MKAQNKKEDQKVCRKVPHLYLLVREQLCLAALENEVTGEMYIDRALARRVMSLNLHLKREHHTKVLSELEGWGCLRSVNKNVLELI